MFSSLDDSPKKKRKKKNTFHYLRFRLTNCEYNWKDCQPGYVSIFSPFAIQSILILLFSLFGVICCDMWTITAYFFVILCWFFTCVFLLSIVRFCWTEIENTEKKRRIIMIRKLLQLTVRANWNSSDGRKCNVDDDD